MKRRPENLVMKNEKLIHFIDFPAAEMAKNAEINLKKKKKNKWEQ